MKICVVTIYRNENVGSVLQAYAMQSVLSENNATVVFHKNIASSHTLYKLLRRIAGAILKLRFNTIHPKVYKFLKFSQIQKSVIEVSAKKLLNLKIDCYILGSDVIWDLSVKRPSYY